MPPLAVELLELLIERAFILELQMHLIQLERGQRVLDRVVGIRLDVLVEHEPGQEAERQPALAVLEVIQVDSVDDLFWRNEDVCDVEERSVNAHARREGVSHTDDTEVLRQSVPDEDTPAIDEQTKFLVHHLQRCQGVATQARIKISNYLRTISPSVV